MTNPAPEFCLQENVDGSFTILERLQLDDAISAEYLDYELELKSHEEAIQLLSGINWLEEIYSPPRA